MFANTMHWLKCSFNSQDQWVAALKTLDLTMEEVVHIRSVLTRAELEALPLDGNLKEDVEKGKVSFRMPTHESEDLHADV